jgi:hypothetical protein
MTGHVIAFTSAALLLASPAGAAELLDTGAAGAARNGAVAGAYIRLALDGPSGAGRTAKAGLRLALTRTTGDPRAYATVREAKVLDLRLSNARPAFYVIGQPVAGAAGDRLNAAGESKGRLDKIMIGAGIALGVVAGFFLVSSVTG